MIAGLLLGRGEKPEAETAVLPLVGRCRGAEGDHAPVDVELAQERSVVEFLAEGPVREPEPGEPDKGVLRARLDETLLAAAGRVDRGRDRRRLRCRRPADLAAPDAPAVKALRMEPRLRKLPEVAVPGARDDQFRRYVPLDPLEADVLREKGLCIGNEIDQFLLGIRAVSALFPEALDLRSRRHQGRVDLQEVRPEPRVGEEFLKHPPVVRHACPGEVRHNVKPNLQPGVAQEAVCRDRVCDRVTPPVVVEDPVVQVLDAEFYLGHAHREHPVDMLFPAPVGPCLEGGGDAPDFRPLICSKNRIKVGLCRGSPVPGVVVHRLHGSADKPLLVLDRSGGHRPAHNDQLRFVDVVPERLELFEAGLHLVVGVERVFPRPERRGFFARITLGRLEGMLRSAGTGEALPVGAGVRRGHHRNGRHPRERPRGFDEEKRPEPLVLFRRSGGENSRVFGHIGAGFPADLKFDPLNVGGAGCGRKDAGDHLPEGFGIAHRLMFGCNPF